MMTALQEAFVGEQLGRTSRDGVWNLPRQWGELVELCHLGTRQRISYVIISTRYMHCTYINIILSSSKIQ